MKRLVSLVLCGAIFFTLMVGCANKNSQDTHGGYLEFNITPGSRGQAVLSYISSVNGCIRVYSSDLKQQWDSYDNGEIWTKADGPLADTHIVPKCVVQVDNSLWIATANALYFTTSEGIEKLELPAFEAARMRSGASLQSCMAAGLSENVVLLAFTWKLNGTEDERGNWDRDYSVGLYDRQTGERLREYRGFEADTLIVQDTYFYIADVVGTLRRFDRQSGEEMGVVADLRSNPEIPDPVVYFLGGPDGEEALYGANTQQVKTVSLAGGEISQVMSTSRFSIGDPSGEVVAAMATEDGALVFIYRDPAGNSRVYRYVWSLELTDDPQAVLEVWSLYENRALRKAIADFSATTPYTIEYIVPDLVGSAISVEDAINLLNTRVLTGNGPDVILLDGINVEAHIALGTLIDLTPYVDTGAVYPKLVEGFTRDGQLLALPTGWQVTALVGPAGSIMPTTLEALLQLVMAGPGIDFESMNTGGPSALVEQAKPVLWLESFSEAFDTLWLSYASNLVENGKLNLNVLEAFLESLEALVEHHALLENGGRHSTLLREGYIGYGPVVGQAVAVKCSGSAQAALTGNAAFGALQLDNLLAFMVLMYSDIYMPHPDMAFSSFPGMQQTAGWQPLATVGIFEGCANPDAAGQFIEYLLDDSMQLRVEKEGLPITRSGIQQLLQNYNGSSFTEDTGPVDITQMLEQFETLAENLGTPNLLATEQMQWIYEIALGYMEGGYSLDEALQQANNRFELYLEEMN